MTDYSDTYQPTFLVGQTQSDIDVMRERFRDNPNMHCWVRFPGAKWKLVLTPNWSHYFDYYVGYKAPENDNPESY